MLFSCSWSENQPVTYQAFHNLNFGKNVQPELWQQWELGPDYVTSSLRPDIKTESTMSVHPIFSRHLQCTLMLMLNLAKTHWITIPCNVSLLPCLVCCNRETFSSRLDQRQMSFSPSQTACRHFAFIKDEVCFLFRWFHGPTERKLTFHGLCPPFGMKPLAINNNKVQFSTLLSAVGHTTFQLLFSVPSNLNILQQISYKRIWMNVSYIISKQHVQMSKGFLICSNNSSKIPMSMSNLFKCNNYEYISTVFVLNGADDCNQNGSKLQGGDENCPLQNSTCPLKCYIQSCLCSPVHYKSSQGLCLSYTKLLVKREIKDVMKKINRSELSCNSMNMSTKLDIAMSNDLFPDCPLASDELLYKQLLLYEYQVKTTCSLPNQIPCQDGHPRCYNISQICIHKLDKNRYPTPCRTGSHMESCKDMQCNILFKCLYFYCIPWSYVCNGVWDCPHGLKRNIKLW